MDSAATAGDPFAEFRNPYNPSDDVTPPVREAPALTENAFVGLPGEIVRVIAPHTESDPAGLLLSAHTFFGNCIGRGPHYRVESTSHGTNLYVIKVGDTSKARKGTGENRVRSLFHQVDNDWASHRIHTGLSSGEGVIWAVRDPITGFEKQGKGSTAARVEVELDPGVADKRLLVVESEFAGALRVMQREGNILSRVMRDGWDDIPLATMTKNTPGRATGTCLSVIGHITATELKAYFDRTEMANGFGNRFLFACVKRAQLLPFGGTLTDGDLAELARQIRHAVNIARRLGEIRMTPDARDVWRDIYPELSKDRPGLLGALTARSEAQTVRLATLYALWDGANQIGQDHLIAALAIEDFCRKSVEYIFGDMLGDPIADTILEALRAAETAGLTRTEINNLFARNVSSNQIANALGELARRGLAAQRRGTVTTGRPPEIWVAV